jgi:hypothetical protein
VSKIEKVEQDTKDQIVLNALHGLNELNPLSVFSRCLGARVRI